MPPPGPSVTALTQVGQRRDDPGAMREPRYGTNLETRFELGSFAGEGRIENASTGGVFIRTHTIPDRGEKVWISFEGPEGEVVEASGVVWWTTLDGHMHASQQPGFGVRLVASSGDYRRLLKRLAKRG
jgi:hypothetical protein